MEAETRTAFVTGASYGIGAATALALAQDGCNVAVAATRSDHLAGIVERLQAVTQGVVPVALDVRSQESIEQAMAEVIAVFGHVDVLVNNAGITLQKKALEVTPEQWDNVNSTNLRGAFFMSQQMGQHLVSTGRKGCIINIASTHGLIGLAGRSVYGISKAAMIHMTKMLAIEWAEHGIRVNAVAPGRVDSGSPMRTASARDPKLLEALHARVPLHRSATNEEVAEAVRYLASPAAEYITGHTLVLDGGLTAY
ncbi:MAG TPA: glucose 1-dehydrogenase [Burkholderiales bacterium]|nr:glucose 1-dehydrogenase [Burkholderiales bacterium]